MSSPLISSVTLSATSLSNDIYPPIATLRPNWSASDLHLHQLTGGISNATFSLSNGCDQSDTLVIKIFGLKTETFLNRDAEITHLSILSNYGLAQPILLQFSNGFIYKFIPGSVCNEEDVRDIQIAPLIACHLAKFHSIPLQGRHQKPCLMPLIRKFLALISQSQHLPAEFASLSADVDWIEYVVLPRLIPDPQYGIDLVLCHNDLVCTNILYHSASQSVSFIDFEYCGINYALFDVANHFVEYAGLDQIHFDRYPERTEQRRWLKTYFAARNLTVDDHKKVCERIDQFSALAHLCYGLWAFVQVSLAKVDSDYASYGQRRLNRYKELKSVLLSKYEQ